MRTVLLSVGDASGDHHAAELVRALRRRCPDLAFAGMGGGEMRAAGVDLLVDQKELAVGGLLELAGNARRLQRAWSALVRAVGARRPELVVLVDSGAFNLPLARRVRRRSDARILYYVAPQVWAWRPGRIRKIARRVDRLAVILPFEPGVYEGSGLRAEFVGHPLVDPLERLRQHLDRKGACAELGLDPERRWIAILPGSRRNEVAHHLPIQLDAVRRLHARDPRLAFAIALAPSIERARVEREIARARLPSLLDLRVVGDATRTLLLGSHVVLAKPGTGLLEAALLERPMVAIGRANRLTAAIVRRALRVPHLAMPNLIAGREIVPEYLQEAAQPDVVAEAVWSLVEGPARERQLAGLREVRERLGSGGAAERAAAIAEEMLGPVERV